MRSEVYIDSYLLKIRFILTQTHHKKQFMFLTFLTFNPKLKILICFLLLLLSKSRECNCIQKICIKKIKIDVHERHSYLKYFNYFNLVFNSSWFWHRNRVNLHQVTVFNSHVALESIFYLFYQNCSHGTMYLKIIKTGTHTIDIS